MGVTRLKLEAANPLRVLLLELFLLLGEHGFGISPAITQKGQNNVLTLEMLITERFVMDLPHASAAF